MIILIIANIISKLFIIICIYIYGVINIKF